MLSSSLLTLTSSFQVEKNLLLEEKVKTLQQENEDLQVRTQKHLVMARSELVPCAWCTSSIFNGRRGRGGGGRVGDTSQPSREQRGLTGAFSRGSTVPFVCRQLSEELLAARGALEKEEQLRDQARREKEELLYRVLHGGDGPPFPIAAGEVPLIAT